MAKDVWEDGLEVVGMNRGLAVEEGVRTGRGLQREAGTHRDGMVVPDERAGGLAERQQVALEVVGDGNRRRLSLQGGEVFQREDRVGLRPAVPGGRIGVGVKTQDLELDILRGEVHRNRKEEAVELWFGEGKGAGGRGVVLSGDHQEGIRERLGVAVDGDLVARSWPPGGRTGCEGRPG